METNSIYHGDCMELLKKIPDESVDLIISDPPYNIGIAEWDYKKSVKDYLDWLNPIIEEYFRVLRKNGSLYIFGNFNFIGDIKVLLNKQKAKLMSWIIWDKGSKEQNATRTYADITEHILFYVKGNYEKDIEIPTELNSVREYLREEKKKSGLSNKYFSEEFSKLYDKVGCRDRSVIEHYFSEKQWVFPIQEIYEKILQKTGFFQKPYDVLKQEYKQLRYTFNHEDIRIKRNPKDKRNFKFEKQICPNVWYFNNKYEMTLYSHPTVKPLELIETIIKVSSNEGDIVLDTFLGSGSTIEACNKLNRRWVGSEINADYISMINKQRLSQQTLSNLSATPRTLNPTDSIPTGEFNMGLTASATPSPKCPSDTSPSPNLNSIWVSPRSR